MKISPEALLPGKNFELLYLANLKVKIYKSVNQTEEKLSEWNEPKQFTLHTRVTKETACLGL